MVAREPERYASPMRPFVAMMLLACSPLGDPAGPGVAGGPSDVETRPGDYAGYRVVMPCPEGLRDVGVVGAGSVELDEIEAIAAVGRELGLALSDVESVWGVGGYGLGCEPGVGTTVWLDDWRDVDRTIAIIGAFLARRDLSLQVGIDVGSIPVAQ